MSGNTEPLWYRLVLNILELARMIELNRKRRLLIATAHMLGCVVSLLVLLALPTLRFHHTQNAVRVREVEREAARQSFVTPTDSTIVSRSAQAPQRWIFGIIPLVETSWWSVCSPSVVPYQPLARILMRLKMPPPSQDPFQLSLVQG